MEMSKLLVKDLMNGKFELISDYIYQIANYVIKVPQGLNTVGQVLYMTISIQRDAT